LLYPPEQCSVPATAFQPIAVLAGTYGLSINAGHLARRDRETIQAACRQLNADFNSGSVTDDAVYLLHPGLVEKFTTIARQPVVCAEIDGIPVCVTSKSYQPWKKTAHFQ
jgi:hypothetical protein